MQSRKYQSPNGRGREILKENLKQKIFNKSREKYLQNGKEKKDKKKWKAKAIPPDTHQKGRYQAH